MSPIAASVVIPAWNAGRWLSQTIESVVSQTVSPDALEVIVVDDGSSDETASVARAAFAKSEAIRARILSLPSSQGPSFARNVGWREAEANWIQFLDADDLLAPGKLQLQLERARELSADIGALFSPWCRLREAGQGWQPENIRIDPALSSDPLLDVLRADNFIHLGCQLFRRDWLEAVGGFDESLRLVEDVDCQLRLLMRNCGMHRVDAAEPTFYYRQRHGSLSRGHRGDFVAACVRNVALVESFWRTRGELSDERASALTEHYFAAARYFAEHDAAAFAQTLERIQRLTPDALPAGPRSLRYLARIVGYPAAERVAIAYRKVKQSFLAPA